MDDAAKPNEGWFPEVVSVPVVDDWPKLNPRRSPEVVSFLAVEDWPKLTRCVSRPGVEVEVEDG